MVTRVSSRGFFEWLVQRFTALTTGVYAVFILIYLLTNQPMYYAQWHELFHHTAMKIFTSIVLLSTMWHAWIGLWTVFTDYVKPAGLRLTLMVILAVLLIGYLFWGFEIFWTT